eukprot:scaffold32493_cov59-Attheya_sp.AAC.7
MNTASSTSATGPQFIMASAKNKFENKTDDDLKSSSFESFEENLRERSALVVEIDQSIKEMQEKVGEEHEEVAFMLETVAEGCFLNGDYGDAHVYYSRALILKTKLLGSDHSETADIHYCIGNTLKKQDQLNESLESFGKAMLVYQSIHKDRFHKTDVTDDGMKIEILCKLVSTMNCIGDLFFEHLQFENSLQSFQHALPIANIAVESAKDLTAESYKSFVTKTPAKCVGQTNNIQKDRLLFQMARTHLCNVLSNIANVHAQQGHKLDAVKFYNEALALQMEDLGEEDPAIATTLNNIGTLNFRAGNYSVALKSYKQVLKMRRKLLGFDHSSVSDVLINLAHVYDKMGDLKTTKEACYGALQVAKKAYGERSIRAANIMVVLADVVARMGDQDALVLSFLTDALKAYKFNRLSESHVSVITTNAKITKLKEKTNGGGNDLMTSISNACGCIFSIDDPCFPANRKIAPQASF